LTRDEEGRSLFHPSFTLFRYQAEMIAYGVYRPNNILAMFCGLGKALRNDQLVATPGGWKRISVLRVGDRIFGFDGLPHKITGVYPQGVRPMNVVTTTDGTEIIADDDHLWEVIDNHRRYSTRVLTTAELAAHKLKLDQRGCRFYLPMTRPVQYRKKDFPLDPYTLGALLGDGGLHGTTIHITTGDPDLVKALVLPPGVTAKPVTGSTYHYTLSQPRGSGRNPLTSILASFGLRVKSEHKFIPQRYLHGSFKQRRELLRGLMDTDGYCGSPSHKESGRGARPGSMTYGSVSRQLVADVVELVCSLGGIARFNGVPKKKYYRKPDGTKVYGKPFYETVIVLPNDGWCPFFIERKMTMWEERHNPTRRQPSRGIISIVPTEPAEATCITTDAPGRLFLTNNYVVTHNSVCALATACFLLEDDLIDRVIIECEGSKLFEFKDDIAEHTSLVSEIYHGTRRKDHIDAGVLISTYETIRNDLAVDHIKTVSHRDGSVSNKKTLLPGPLLGELTGKRLLWIADEAPAKMGATRTSAMYRKHAYAFEHLNKHGELKVMVLSATPMDRDPEGFFNLVRAIRPVCTVEEFKREHISGYDYWGNPTGFKNLHEDRCEPGIASLREKVGILLAKSIEDPDVARYFPEMPPPTFSHITLGAKQAAFYEDVVDIFDGDSRGFSLLRQIAGCPLSITQSESPMSRQIVNKVGYKGLEALGSAKLDALVERLAMIKRQGSAVVIYSFYVSMLGFIERRLLDEGFEVVTSHGEMTRTSREKNKRKFLGGDAEIFLSSDANARGINLPVAAYVENFELPLTGTTYTQRISRIRRPNSIHSTVFAHSFIAADTVEEGIAAMNTERQSYHDLLVEDDITRIPSDIMKRLMRISKSHPLEATTPPEV